MRTLDDFAELAHKEGATIGVRADRSVDETFLEADALLQTPLIALCLLLMADGSRLGVEAGHTASTTSQIFAAYFAGLGDARGRLAWSAEMRIKCAEALAGLEAMSLVLVEGVPRRFTLTELGKKTVKAALNEPRIEVRNLARGLQRTHQDVEAMELRLL